MPTVDLRDEEARQDDQREQRKRDACLAETHEHVLGVRRPCSQFLRALRIPGMGYADRLRTGECGTGTLAASWE